MLAIYFANLFLGCISGCFGLTMVSTSSLSEGKNVSNCSRVEEGVVKTVYAGWPFALSCGEHFSAQIFDIFAEESSYETDPNSIPYYYDYGTQEVDCVIWNRDTNQLLLNKTFVYDEDVTPSYEVQSNESINLEVILMATATGECISVAVLVNLTTLSNQTCSEAFKTSSYVLSLEGAVDDYKTLPCVVPDSHHPKLKVESYTHKWFYNCGDLPNNTESSREQRNGLYIPRITYENAGTYTCALMRNGMTLYAIHIKLCIQPVLHQPRESLKCASDSIHAKPGDIAKLECFGKLSSRLTGLFTTKVVWKKKNHEDSYDPHCINLMHNERHSYTNPNVKCSYAIKKTPCFHHVPNEKERESAEKYSKEIKLTLTMENVKESDFGEYLVILSSTGQKNSTVDAVTTLVKDETSLTNVVYILYVCVGIMVALVFTAVAAYLLYKYRVKLRLLRQKARKEDIATIKLQV